MGEKLQAHIAKKRQQNKLSQIEIDKENKKRAEEENEKRLKNEFLMRKCKEGNVLILRRNGKLVNAEITKKTKGGHITAKYEDTGKYLTLTPPQYMRTGVEYTDLPKETEYDRWKESNKIT